ncbi:MAG: GNAT family N-acetyltransferase [Solibacillus sp.]|uniref:GNAT family N-acetyltransferase n=1 Tax=Solibacillus sp. TaxID=1909654 RepID=UPI003316405A
MGNNLNEATEHAKSKNTELMIRKLKHNENPPMDLLLLADPSEKSITKYLDKSEVYVAVEKNIIIGVYALMEIGPKRAELMNIAVADSHQGKGMGKALVLHAIEVARANDMQSIELGTGNSSIQQLALYQKCGFRMKEIIHDHFVEQYDEPIFEQGIQCRDMVRLSIDLKSNELRFKRFY